MASITTAFVDLGGAIGMARPGLAGLSIRGWPFKHRLSRFDRTAPLPGGREVEPPIPPVAATTAVGGADPLTLPGGRQLDPPMGNASPKLAAGCPGASELEPPNGTFPPHEV